MGNGLIAYVSRYASDELAASLTQAGDYEVRFREYDWGLNATAD